MTSAVIYSTNYYQWETLLPQAAPIRLITDQTHPIKVTDERLQGISWWQPDIREREMDPFLGRVSAAWWSFHPHLAVPDAEVTIFIGANFTTQMPDLAERCLEELGDDDMLVMRHPWRDDIIEEAQASLESWRWNDGRQDVVGQAAAYTAAGHPRHWGLFHGGMVVRRDTPTMRAFNEVWFDEYRRWTSQNQISLPHLLRTSGIRWHAFPDVGEWRASPFEEGWVRWGGLGRELVAA